VQVAAAQQWQCGVAGTKWQTAAFSMEQGYEAHLLLILLLQQADAHIFGILYQRTLDVRLTLDIVRKRQIRLISNVNNFFFVGCAAVLFKRALLPASIVDYQKFVLAPVDKQFC
jgi:hypothetical protein